MYVQARFEWQSFVDIYMSKGAMTSEIIRLGKLFLFDL